MSRTVNGDREPNDVLALVTAELLDSGIDESSIAPDVAIDDLDLESLDVAQLLAAIQKRFGVVLQPPDLAGRTVGDLVHEVAGRGDRTDSTA